MAKAKKKASSIISGSREYPCFPTMGAMLRYERMTGKKFSESDGSVSDALERLYCQACSACEAMGVEKPGDMQQFCDGIAPEDFNAWALSQADDGKEGDGEKKA